MKRILVIYYSQSGDVENAVNALTAPLEGQGIEITRQRLEPRPAHPFPWGAHAFFDTMPEAIHGEATALAPLGFAPTARFDLVIIAWQVWFLSPSLPIRAFFNTPQAAVLRDTRVITLTCCRQMWQRAHAQMKALIRAAGGRHTDSVVVTHQGSPLATFLTAPRLMLTGKRDQVGFLPAAGVARQEIASLARFGQRLRETQDRWNAASPQPLLKGLGGVNVKLNALVPELIGIAFMLFWARILRLCGPRGSAWRRPMVWIYVPLLVLIVPIALTASALLTPILRRVFARRLSHYLQAL